MTPSEFATRVDMHTDITVADRALLKENNLAVIYMSTTGYIQLAGAIWGELNGMDGDKTFSFGREGFEGKEWAGSMMKLKDQFLCNTSVYPRSYFNLQDDEGRVYTQGVCFVVEPVSETPRTDAWQRGWDDIPVVLSAVEKMSQLELELAAVTKERDELRARESAISDARLEAFKRIMGEQVHEAQRQVEAADTLNRQLLSQVESVAKELNVRLIERTAAYEARERALLEEIRRLKAGEPTVTVPPQDVMHAGKFTCPKCGGHYWSLRDPSSPIECWIGVCDGHDGNNRTCDFTWHRATQDKDVFH